MSDVDRGAEQIVRDALLGAYPGAAFIGEESYDPATSLASLGTGGLAFVVDPLDGTTNFLHGFPWYAVSIGAVAGGEPFAGVVRNVPTGETFAAAAGAGAWRVTGDGPDAAREPIRVTSNTDPARALVGTGFPFKNVGRIDEYLRHFAAITRATAGIRRPGAAALDLCDVACGRFDAFWELTLSPVGHRRRPRHRARGRRRRHRPRRRPRTRRAHRARRREPGDARVADGDAALASA